MKQIVYNQLCIWDSTVENDDSSTKPTLSQVLSLYTGMGDIDGILCDVRTHHAEWEKIAKRNGLTFDGFFDRITDTMIYQYDPKIEFQILRYCGDGTLTTLVEITKGQLVDRWGCRNYKIDSLCIELDWHIDSLAE